jgi:hypothetical protein
LLLEKNVSGGVGAAAVGILGGAAMGAVFGPIGYLVTRVGTSVVSYASAIGKPVPVITPPDLGPVVTGLNETNRSIHQLHADLAPIMTQLATERARFAPAAAVQAPADTVTRAELNEAVHQILAEIKNLPHKRGTSS